MSRTLLPYCLAVSRRIGATPAAGGVLQSRVLLDEPAPAAAPAPPAPVEAPVPAPPAPAPGPMAEAAPDPPEPVGSTSWPTQAEKPASATTLAPSKVSLCPSIAIRTFRSASSLRVTRVGAPLRHGLAQFICSFAVLRLSPA